MSVKRFRMVVRGTDFDAESQLLVNNISLSLESPSTIEQVGQFVNALVQALGELTCAGLQLNREDFEYTYANGKSIFSVRRPATKVRIAHCKLDCLDLA